MIHGVDLFCGGGGFTTGLISACRALRRQTDLLAINHWNIAIATHTYNHPGVRHMCESLELVSPRKVVPEGHLDIMVASLECTHHSNARGGRPMRDQSRASAWHVLQWADALSIDNIIVENVREFQDWGPLDDDGKRIKEKAGDTYKAFLQAIMSLGYSVESRVLNAADFGDATTRRRLFIIARRGDRKINWPAPTHANAWRPAREIIDWSIPSKSIFDRKKPLAPATMSRITAGLEKFGTEELKPFLVVFRNNQGAMPLERPLPTMTTSGANFGLCEPFLVRFQGSHKGKDDGARRVHSLQEPLPVQDTSNRYGLCEPFLVKFYRTGRACSLDQPVDTIAARDHIGLVVPYKKGAALDINFRMLQPLELARAMGFPESYVFAGTREAKVKQIGNAVPVHLAEALCRSVLED